MTSLLLDRREATDAGTGARRPLVLIATLGGMFAALAPLAVLAAVGIVGWFAADAGAHGAPRDGMRVGALAWLMAHGSGVVVQGVTIGLVPLGLTAGCAWTVWRVAQRVGEALSGHGPDADRILDGERDLTVPSAGVSFVAGYVVVAVVVASLAATPETAPSIPRAVLWSLAMGLLVAVPAISIGSGRAAIWAALVPPVVRQGLRVCFAIVTAYLVVSTVVLLVALGLGIGQAATMMSQLHLSAGESAAYLVGNAAFAPNASLLSGSFLLGPGFAVGGGTLVSTGAVVLGPLPLFALLAALPATGTPEPWLASMVALPSLVAALAVARWHRRHPTLSWTLAALRGCGGGIGAGVVFALLAALAGGAAGPGRMRHVGAFVPDVMFAGITSFGLGGLVGALAMTWWMRRGAEAESDLDSAG